VLTIDDEQGGNSFLFNEDGAAAMTMQKTAWDWHFVVRF